jgi:hypothetical protein
VRLQKNTAASYVEVEMKKQFNVIISLMTARSADSIIAAFVNKGYTVGPLNQTGEPVSTFDDNLVSMLALSLLIEIDSKVKQRHVVYACEQVKIILRDIGVKYYSLVFFVETPDATWNCGNVIVHEEPKNVVDLLRSTSRSPP